MVKMKAGFIGFMPFGDPNMDFYGLLKTYAELGYRGFEGGDMLLRNGDPAENLKKVQSYGIEPITMGYMKRSMDGREIKIGDIIKNAHKIGVKRITSFSGIVASYRFGRLKELPTYDEVMKEIEEYESVAAECAKEDIVFAFHNHDIELSHCYKGVPALYLMCANSEHLTIELDIGWVLAGGKDPATVIRDLGKRICALHIKDFIKGTVKQEQRDGHSYDMPRFVTPGTGLVDLSACLEEGTKLNLEWAVVEQDFQYNLTQKETLACAYLNMKETGFLE